MFKDKKNLLIIGLTILLIFFVVMYNNKPIDKSKNDDLYDQLHKQNDSLQNAYNLVMKDISDIRFNESKYQDTIKLLSNKIIQNDSIIDKLKNKRNDAKNTYRNADAKKLGSFYTDYFNNHK